MIGQDCYDGALSWSETAGSRFSFNLLYWTTSWDDALSAKLIL